MSSALVRFFSRGALQAAVAFPQKGYAVPSAVCAYLEQPPAGGAAAAAPFLSSAAPLEPVEVRGPAADEKAFDIRLDVLYGAPPALEIVQFEWINDTPVFRGDLRGFRRHVEKGFGQC